MTDAKLIHALLNGHYIRKRSCRRKGYNHALYNKDLSPVATISDTLMRKYNSQFKENKGIITLNLNLVRQQHGNILTKKLYKEHRKKTAPDNRVLTETFICKSCQCICSVELCLRTDGFCYLCDPNITLEECLSDEPILKNPEIL